MQTSDNKVKQSIEATIAAVERIGTIEDVDDLLRSAVEVGVTEVGFERCHLYLWDEGMKAFRGTYGVDLQGNIITLPSRILTVDDLPEINESRQVFLDQGGPDGEPWVCATAMRDDKSVLGLVLQDTGISKKEPDQDVCDRALLFAAMLGRLIQLRLAQRRQFEIESRLEIAGQVVDRSDTVVIRWKRMTDRVPEFVSDNLHRLIGVTPKEMLAGRVSWLDLVHPDDIDEVQVTLAKLPIRMTGSFHLEYRIISPVRGLRWVHATLSRHRGSSSRLAVEGIFQDVTERKLREHTQEAFTLLATHLSSAEDVRTAARSIADATHFLLGWDAFTLDLFSHDGEILQPVLMMDTIDGTLQTVDHSACAGPPTDFAKKVLKSGAELVLRNPSEQGSLALMHGPFGDVERRSESMMFVALRDGRRSIGIISVHSYKREQYSASDLATLKTVAGYCSSAIARLLASEALRNSERTLRSFFDGSPIMMGTVELLDDDIRFLAVNLAASNAFHTTPEAMEGKLATEVGMAPSILNRFLNSYRECHALGVPTAVEYERTVDGTRYSRFGTVAPIPTPEGARPRFCFLTLDITDRIAAEQSLEESLARMRAVLDYAPDAILTVRDDGTIEAMNPAAMKLFGMKPEDVAATPAARLLPTVFDLPTGDEPMAPNFDILGTSPTIQAIRAGGDEFPAEVTIGTVDFRETRLFSVIVRDVTERVKAEQEIQRQLHRLQALHQVDEVISTQHDDIAAVEAVLRHVVGEIGGMGAVFKLDPSKSKLKLMASLGFERSSTSGLEVSPHQGLIAAAIQSGQSVSTSNLLLRRGLSTREVLLAAENVREYRVIPLITQGGPVGVLEWCDTTTAEISQDELQFLQTLAAQAALAIENIDLFRNLERSNRDLTEAYDATLQGWVQALDLRDKETEGHSQRVTRLTVLLAKQMGIEGEELEQVRRGALLHDIGKIGVPDQILNKPGPLDDEEMAIIRLHPAHAYSMLAPIRYLVPALHIPYGHHEKWDGTGYPQGLAGDQIPLAARIFSIIDVWDALRSDRPYRKSWSVEKCRAHVLSLAGKHFDPMVVAEFLKLVESGEVQ